MTRIFYRSVRRPKEVELPFVKWDDNGTLVVRQPPGWKHPGREMRYAKRTVLRLLDSGRLRIEGDKPEWAQIKKEQ